MKEILNCEIDSIEIDTHLQQYLILNTKDERSFIYVAYGDCCSESWFADLIGVDNLIHGKVLKVEEVSEYEIADNRTRQEFDKVYSFKITTNKGITDIIFRNSSNGYYGGDLSLVESRPNDIEFEQIKDDYSA